MDGDEQMYFGLHFGLPAGARLPPDALAREGQIRSDEADWPLLRQLVVTGLQATTSLDDEW